MRPRWPPFILFRTKPDPVRGGRGPRRLREGQGQGACRVRETTTSRIRGIYAILDTVLVPDPTAVLRLLEAVLRGGARAVQLRSKNLHPREIATLAVQMRERCSDAGALFVLNDRLDLALLIHADAVHLGQADFPLDVARRVAGRNLLLGISTHAPDQAKRAVLGGADYIGFGPIYPTATKHDAASPVGVEALRGVVAETPIPVVAIGGIREDNLRDVLQARPQAVAVVSELAASPDPEEKTRTLVRILDESRRSF